MCIGLYTLSHPDYALIICANRDEFLDRPTLPAAWHDFELIKGSEASLDPRKDEVGLLPGEEAYGKGRVLSGRDGTAGGTWLGITREGRVGLLTNITEPRATYTTTRGELASNWLLSEGKLDMDAFTFNLTGQRGWKSYAGFNLLLLDPKWSSAGSLSYTGAYATNSGGGGIITSRVLDDEELHGVGGISNGIESLDGREWAKLCLGREKMKEVVDAVGEGVAEEDVVERLFEILSLHSPEPIIRRSDLRNTIRVEPFMLPNTAASGETKLYGTMLHTALLVKRNGDALFVERDAWVHSPDGELRLGSKENDRICRFSVGGRK